MKTIEVCQETGAWLQSWDTEAYEELQAYLDELWETGWNEGC